MENQLQPLFEATLEYAKEKKPVVTSEGRRGELLGSGNGTIDGKQFKGSIEWSIFEIVGNPCETSIAGIIRTQDGATIHLDSTGYGLKRKDANGSLWKMSATLKFSTSDERYGWLKDVIAVWDGSFDQSTGIHHYRAFASPNTH